MRLMRLCEELIETDDSGDYGALFGLLSALIRAIDPFEAPSELRRPLYALNFRLLNIRTGLLTRAEQGASGLAADMHAELLDILGQDPSQRQKQQELEQLKMKQRHRLKLIQWQIQQQHYLNKRQHERWQQQQQQQQQQHPPLKQEAKEQLMRKELKQEQPKPTDLKPELLKSKQLQPKQDNGTSPVSAKLLGQNVSATDMENNLITVDEMLMRHSDAVSQ